MRTYIILTKGPKRKIYSETCTEAEAEEICEENNYQYTDENDNTWQMQVVSR